MNVSLTKDDGLILVLPAGSITAVLSTASAKNPEHPDAKAVVFSTFRGLSIFFLSQTAKEAFKALSERSVPGREWLELPIRDDAQYIDPAAVSAVEGERLEEGDQVLRVWFTRGDGQPVYADANHSVSLLEQISTLIGRDATAPEQAPKPAVRHRAK